MITEDERLAPDKPVGGARGMTESAAVQTVAVQAPRIQSHHGLRPTPQLISSTRFAAIRPRQPSEAAGFIRRIAAYRRR